jgi:hypothetical protein
MRRVDGTDLAAVRSFARASIGLLGEGVNEQVLKQNFLTHLPGMFTSRPTWIARHTRGAEAQTRYADDGQLRSAFMDNVVGYTSVEWERDLSKRTIFDAGYEQVRTHVAGQINSGAPVEQVVGVLSDTVRWYAYRVGAVRSPSDGSPLGPGDVDLEQERRLDISGDTSHAHAELAEFLIRYFGREGAQPLTADTIAFDLGMGSEFCERSLPSIAALVDRAMAARPDYASVIERLWSEFVAYLGGEPDQSAFDDVGYTAELYTVTLAKLICANVIARAGLHSDDAQLRAILAGDHFKALGLVNLVEYDYFGWLNERPFVDGLIPVAREMQADLRAYDFLSTPEEDLFGHMLAELADGQRRILLGQEWTPTWLARQMAREMVDAMPTRELPRFVDMCCGSGSMLVQVVHAWLARVGRADASASELANALTQVATGFDVDPLAVMLAKVNWVIATHAHLDSFATGQPVVIPIYLADSLWAKTPIGVLGGAGAKVYTLTLGDQTLRLPAFLVRPSRRRLFDALLDHAHSLASEQAALAEGEPIDPAALELALEEACGDASDELDGAEGQATQRFLHKLVEALSALQRDEVNGIWTFVLRNSYRPGLMAHQFNGLISNPPWLALSKVANNPYRQTLRAEAAAYGVKPEGQSHPHTELATTFLLAATDRYLREGALIACVLPDTVLNGHHHTPFRRRAYARARRRVDLQVTRLWRVQGETFKNEAIVLFAAKLPGAAGEPLPGSAVGLTSRTPLTFQTVTLQDRTVWTDRPAAQSGGRATGEMGFRQGADIMPRSAIFHQVTALRGGRWRIAPIDDRAGLLRYLLAQGKRLCSFRITPTVVPGRFLFPVLISKHLAPFALSEPALALLPIERGAPAARWRPVSETRLAAAPAAAAAFGEIFAAHERERSRAREFSLADYFAALDTHRRKLTAQRFPNKGYLVLYGAGGSWPCAATLDLSRLDSRRLIVDQTLYWLAVEDEAHALYLAGLINSKAAREPIREFQPRGSFDERHVHKLPGRVIPSYDPTCPQHAAVVDATRALSEEFAALRESGRQQELFDPSRGLAWRRRMIRTEVLPRCPAFAPYARACSDLYFSAAGHTIR